MLIIYLFINRIDAFGENYNLKFTFVFPILFSITVLIVHGIIIPRALFITIDKKFIKVSNIFSSKQYSLENIKGFSKKVEITKSGLKFEMLELITNNNKKIIVSESMYRNYRELKNRIAASLGEFES
jgi:hypothetical protein